MLCPRCRQPRPDHAAGCPAAPPPAAGVPWSIPIRDRGADVPQRTATWVDQVPLLGLAVGAIAVFLLLGVAAIVMGTGSPDDSSEDAGREPEVLRAEVTSPSTAAGADDDATAVTTTTTSSTSTSSTTRTTSTDAGAADAEQATGREPSPEPDGVPILAPGELSDGWVAQLSSVPSSAGGNALETAYETVAADVPAAVVLRGSEWPSLRPGFFVIVQPGFSSGAEAVDACVAAGRPDRDDCFGRYLAADGGDERVCYREEAGTLGGDCT